MEDLLDYYYYFIYYYYYYQKMIILLYPDVSLPILYSSRVKVLTYRITNNK
jgi:hypothetical protein